MLLCNVTYCQIGRLHLSPRQHVTQKIALTTIDLDFSRPAIRDRVIFGELVPFDQYWRTGANQNSTIEFDQDVFIENQRVKKGKYAILTKPGNESWEFILYDEIDNWDVPSPLDSSKIIITTSIAPVTVPIKREVFQIEIGDFTNYAFDLNIYWEHTKVTIPIALGTKEAMDKKIHHHLNGPQYSDYYLAAVYQLESGGEYEKGLEWINKAMEVAGERGWWNLMVKTKLLLNLGRNEEAKIVAKEGLVSANEEKRENIIRQFEQILSKLP